MSTQDASVDFTTQPVKTATRRNAGLDALRACLTLLVVFHHCAITYGAVGGWYYHEVAPDKSLGSVLLVLFCAINQAFFMGLFFFLAGYYTSSSIDHKGPYHFLIDRFLRLGMPLLVYGLLIGPATIALAQTSRGDPFMGTLAQLWRTGTFENGPMWFAQALLMFSVVAALWNVAFSRPKGYKATRSVCKLFPNNLTLAGGAIFTGIAALALRYKWPVGVNVLGLQLGYFASYIVLYAAGCFTARVRWIERLPERQVQIWWCIALIALPILPLVYFLGGKLPELRGHLLTVVYAFWEPFVAWGTILFLAKHFQQRFDGLVGVWRPLSRRAYTIYIVHPPVLVAVALAWRNVPAPPLLKFALTGSLACLLCYLIAGLLLRLPKLSSIL
ncbi:MULTISPECIES: acyltransferase [unclassified Paraburkholderia]|uniref:acyltransferase family protein n=1 Tax=unclassified Paraburkholderia TaxID=2615204 RepID=UPI0016140AB7|nr:MULTISPECIES: acyltransferase [unclassified Paraburkholderia]MBB5448353.1 peptidoglycan/LPS O-acetylase OafA/YrhL [Paraburkholderia sp. WSM4177]MBB5488734.1 peptidoglycan/LPS O-acetylase OafA/YrhL [Paraburkholderia sp. WSM4180]